MLECTGNNNNNNDKEKKKKTWNEIINELTFIKLIMTHSWNLMK